MTWKKTVLGYPICAELTMLDDGAQLLLTGGCKSHIGSVTVADCDGAEQTIALPGHKEAAVSASWAKELAKRLNCRVAVTCGIHYDQLSKEELGQVLQGIHALQQQILDAPLA